MFDIMQPVAQEMQEKMIAKIKSAAQEEDIVMVMYRPAAGEKDEVRGEIVNSSPMKSGLKGFTYNTLETNGNFSSKNSKTYAAQMKALYEKWR